MKTQHTKKKRPKAKSLPPGGTVGVIAPASPVYKEWFHKGLAEIESRGFKVVCPLDPCRLHGINDKGFARNESIPIFGSASVAERSMAFMSLIEDDEVSVIFSIRGGYGSAELLPNLDFKRVAKKPKVLVGFSDVTALLVGITGKTGVPSIHGPAVGVGIANAVESEAAKIAVDQLFRILQDPSYFPSYAGRKIRDGKGSGNVIVGNLTILQTLIGTPWDINYDGAVLIVEDVGEAPYRMHRALMQLKFAGKLEKLSAFVFGRFSKCKTEVGPTMEQVMENSPYDIFEGTEYPVLMDLEIGHNGKNLPIAFGCKAQVEDGIITMLEAPVEG